MNAGRRYLDRIGTMLKQLEETQSVVVVMAGELCADALMRGQRLYVSPDGTHTLHTELTQRAGGFIDLSILRDRRELKVGDVVIIGTNAGFDASTVGLALHCQVVGAKTIGITSVSFEKTVRSVDDSGKMLHEVVDICIDQGGVPGDAVLDFAGLDVPIIPASGILSVAAAWMVLAETADRMIRAGKNLRIYQAIQMPGAQDRNRDLLNSPRSP